MIKTNIYLGFYTRCPAGQDILIYILKIYLLKNATAKKYNEVPCISVIKKSPRLIQQPFRSLLFDRFCCYSVVYSHKRLYGIVLCAYFLDSFFFCTPSI